MRGSHGCLTKVLQCTAAVAAAGGGSGGGDGVIK